MLVALCLLAWPGGLTGVGGAQVESPETDPDSTLLRVDIRADGTAVWTVAYRTRLDDLNATAAFESLAASVAADPATYTARFDRRMAATAAAAANETSREMAIGNVSVSATTTALPARYGVLTYRFEWANFAAVDGDRLRVDESLSGLFLDDGTQLFVTWPEGYSVVTAEPTPAERREGAVIWTGPTEFGPGEPRLDVTTGNPAAVTPLTVGIAVLVVVLVGAGVVVGTRVRAGRSGADSGGEPTTSATASTPTDGGTTPVADAAGPAPELLSNEERVLAALRAAGGRMRQQALVAELGWTEARTSQVLGGLRESGAVESFRLGRENVLTLPAAEDRDTGGHR